VSKRLILDMDPNELIRTSNVRPADLDAELVESIRENGLVQPVVATPYEDGLAVILGNRRTVAAIEAERTVDVIVRYDLGADALRIVAQLIENIHRRNMTESQIAAAYAQLAMDLGMSESEIAKKVGKKREAVRASLKLHQMPQTTKDAVDSGQMDLETALALGSFESDPKAYKRLSEAAAQGKSKLDYRLKEEEKKRERDIQLAEMKAKLLKDGVQVVPKPVGLSYSSGKEVHLHQIEGPDGEKFTPETHAECPGHAACIENYAYSDPKPLFICRDPKRYGHTVTSYYTYKTPEEEAADAARNEEAKRQQEERRQALAIARELRMEGVQKLCQSKKLPKGLLLASLEVLFVLGFERTDRTRSKALDFLGVAKPGEDQAEDFKIKVGRMAEARQPLVAVAMAAAVMEEKIDLVGQAWGSAHRPNVIWWFEVLESAGYTLCDPEAELLDTLREQEERAKAEEAEANAEEEEEWDDEGDDDQDAEASAEPEPTGGEDEEAADETEGDESGEVVSLEELYPEIDEPIAA